MSDDLGDPTAAIGAHFVDAPVDTVDEPGGSAAVPAALIPSSEPLPEDERPFGRYTLLRRLAYGGMGEVFLARQGGAGALVGVAKLVVIKRILGHMRRDNKHRRMFLDEARLQALLNNPHVVQIHDMGEEGGHIYLAMEHVLGPSWRMIIDRMRRSRSHVPIAHVCAMVSQAARGLSYAHNLVDVGGAPLRIVHRDINPHNVLVSYDGEVKIIDFGIAKSELQEGNTETGTIKGKFNYMSPEQSAAHKLDHRSDLFTLGICLQELLTNENPFRRANVVLTLEAIQKEAPVRLARRRPEAGLLQPIVDRCLAKNVNQRFADAVFLSDELDELLASGAVPSPPEPLSSWLRRLFSDELAEHVQILEQTGSCNAMVRRDDAGSQRLRAIPRAVSGVMAQLDVADVETRLTNAPKIDEPSFDVDSVSGEGNAEPSFDEATSSEEGTAATPAAMSLASLSSSPTSTGFDPFADVPAAGDDNALDRSDHHDALSTLEPARRAELTAATPAPSSGSRTVLLAAGVVMVVALVAIGGWYALGTGPAQVTDTQDHQVVVKVPASVGQPPAAPPTITGKAPTPPSTDPRAVAPPEATPEAAAAATPPGRIAGAEKHPKKKRPDEPPPTIAAPVLGTVSIDADGYSVRGRRKVTKGEISTLAVGGGPFDLRLSVKAGAAADATLTVESEPWALVQVDSMGRGRTPLSRIPLPVDKRLSLTFKSPKVPETMSVSVTWTPSGG